MSEETTEPTPLETTPVETTEVETAVETTEVAPDTQGEIRHLRNEAEKFQRLFERETGRREALEVALRTRSSDPKVEDARSKARERLASDPVGTMAEAIEKYGNLEAAVAALAQLHQQGEVALRAQNYDAFIRERMEEAGLDPKNAAQRRMLALETHQRALERGVDNRDGYAPLFKEAVREAGLVPERDVVQAQDESSPVSAAGGKAPTKPSTGPDYADEKERRRAVMAAIDSGAFR